MSRLILSIVAAAVAIGVLFFIANSLCGVSEYINTSTAYCSLEGRPTYITEDGLFGINIYLLLALIIGSGAAAGFFAYNKLGQH
jgi:hypothetical protein